MRKSFLLPGFLCLLLSGRPAAAQRLNNDGFQRRNGQMQVLRNGQLRPMTRDARLPSGTVVTRDGFLVKADGQRTELSEGQGCDLRGNLVAVVPDAAGGLALAKPAAPGRSRAARSATSPGEEVRSVLRDLFGRGRREEDDDKYEEKEREQRKKAEEWAREARKREEEYYRERGKKQKKKGTKWDD